MLEGISLLQLSSERMRYLTQRQSVITRNIANADTPGYQSQDLKPFAPTNPLLRNSEGAGAAPPLRMAVTNSGHLGFGLTGTTEPQLQRKARAYDEKPDANNVSIEEQMVKANDVANAFDVATAAYKSSVALLKTSLGGAG